MNRVHLLVNSFSSGLILLFVWACSLPADPPPTGANEARAGNQATRVTGVAPGTRTSTPPVPARPNVKSEGGALDKLIQAEWEKEFEKIEEKAKAKDEGDLDSHIQAQRKKASELAGKSSQLKKEIGGYHAKMADCLAEWQKLGVDLEHALAEYELDSLLAPAETTGSSVAKSEKDTNSKEQDAKGKKDSKMKVLRSRLVDLRKARDKATRSWGENQGELHKAQLSLEYAELLKSNRTVLNRLKSNALEH